MTIGLYDTATLLEVQRNQRDMPDNFWLQFFPRVVLSDREEILFDEVDDDRRMAPFVAPTAQGRVMKSQGYTTKAFKPAYVKPKHEVNPARAIPRMAGEAIGGEMTQEQRYNAIVAENMRKERMFIERRWDWMAAQAIIFGSVTVSGDDYPEQVVDFGRDDTLTYTKTTTARWGESAANPLADIKAARINAYNLSNAPVNTLIFGLTAWSKFIADDDVKDLLNNERRGSTSEFNITPASGAPFEFQGHISGPGGVGRLQLWTYKNQYDDASGSAVEFLDANYVVGVGGAVNGVRCFGAIQDIGAQLRPLAIFPKMWNEQDPSRTYTMSQSAPLMVPLRPNNTFLIKTYG